MVLCCAFLVSEFQGGGGGDVSTYVCSYYFSSVWVAEWPAFGKELLTLLTICYFGSLTICIFSYFPFWFKGLIWALIASVSWSLHICYFYF